MCEFYRNYYVYSSCADPGVHYFRTSIDGVGNVKCGKAPHERYIVVAGKCTQCPWLGGGRAMQSDKPRLTEAKGDYCRSQVWRWPWLCSTQTPKKLMSQQRLVDMPTKPCTNDLPNLPWARLVRWHKSLNRRSGHTFQFYLDLSGTEEKTECSMRTFYDARYFIDWVGFLGNQIFEELALRYLHG